MHYLILVERQSEPTSCPMGCQTLREAVSVGREWQAKGYQVSTWKADGLQLRLLDWSVFCLGAHEIVFMGNEAECWAYAKQHRGAYQIAPGLQRI